MVRHRRRRRLRDGAAPGPRAVGPVVQVRAELRESLKILQSRTTAGPGRGVKEEQEETPLNQVLRHFLSPPF